MLYVIPIPYNILGDGPETQWDKIEGVDFEVWDELFASHATFKTRLEAERWIQENPLGKL